MSSDWQRLVESFDLTRRRIARLQGTLRSQGVIEARQTIPTAHTPAPTLDTVVNTLDTFPTLVGYLNGRRSSGSIITMESEDNVQDLLFVSLKPLFPDLVYEQPTEKGSAGYSIGDFSLPSLHLVLEAKYVAVKADVKTKADEIAEDIWKYGTQTECETIVFFVYDPKILIPDRASFARMSSATAKEFRIRGRQVEIVTIIKP